MGWWCGVADRIPTSPLVCIVRRQPRETVGVKRPLPHRLGDGSNLGPCVLTFEGPALWRPINALALGLASLRRDEFYKFWMRFST